jgi:hypothetical protein
MGGFTSVSKNGGHQFLTIHSLVKLRNRLKPAQEENAVHPKRGDSINSYPSARRRNKNKHIRSFFGGSVTNPHFSQTIGKRPSVMA